jgi:hypothetical protein
MVEAWQLNKTEKSNKTMADKPVFQTTISDERFKEIAVLFLIEKMAGEKPWSAEVIRREFPNTAKAIGVPEQELLAFAKLLLPKVLKRMIGCNGVLIDWPEEKKM